MLLQSVVGEEDGGPGTFATLRRGHLGDLAVICEPTRGQVVSATAGALTFRLVVPGRSVHASAGLEGVDAVEKYVHVRAALRRLEERRNAAPHPLMAGYRLPYPISVGTLTAGNWASSVPDRVVAEGRLGVALGESLEDARGELERAVAAACADDPWLRQHPVAVEWWRGQFAPGEVEPGAAVTRLVSAAHARVHGTAPACWARRTARTSACLPGSEASLQCSTARVTSAKRTPRTSRCGSASSSTSRERSCSSSRWPAARARPDVLCNEVRHCSASTDAAPRLLAVHLPLSAVYRLHRDLILSGRGSVIWDAVHGSVAAARGAPGGRSSTGIGGLGLPRWNGVLMVSRTVVLGSCGGWPEAGRACSGFVVEHEGSRVVLDLGYGTAPRLFTLLGSSTGEGVDGVVVTHAHPDHVVDVHALFRARWFGSRGTARVPLYAPPGVVAMLAALEGGDERLLDEVFDVHHLPQGRGDPHRVGPFLLETWALPHHVPAVGVRLDAPGLVVAYTGDTGPDPALAELGRDADLFIVDATDRHQRPGVPAAGVELDLTAAQAGAAAAAAGARRLLLTHFWPGNDRRVSATAAAAAFAGPVLVADEGLEITF